MIDPVDFSLVRCGRDGRPLRRVPLVPDSMPPMYAANADLYRRVGFVPPWVSYLAVDADQAVGGGAFVGPPRGNRVEIAYFTLPEFEGKSYATRTAAALLAIAREAMPGIIVVALTLPAQNASTRILERLGFRVVGNTRDPDAGEVWEWHVLTQKIC